jgi:hypothetical protein
MKNTGRNTYLEWYSSKGNWSTYTAGNTTEYYLSFYLQVSAEHVHNYITSVVAPTCTEAGYTTYTCACGDTYTGDEVAALGHTYVEGKCECGAEDPNYVPEQPPVDEPTEEPTEEPEDNIFAKIWEFILNMFSWIAGFFKGIFAA